MISQPSSIWSPFDGYWQTGLTATAWQQRFAGPLPPTCAAWLKPGPRADFVPCPHADGCGLPHRVVPISDRSAWIAVPGGPGCESLWLADVATETRVVDLEKFAHILGHALRLDGVAIERIKTHPALLRLGHTGKTQVPCLFSVASSPLATSRACASATLLQAGPFILFIPLARDLPSALRATLSGRGGGLFALDELLDLDARGQLIVTKKLTDLLSALAPTNYTPGPRLVVPVGTPWSAIHLKIINGQTLIASLGGQTAQASANQLGQVPRDHPDQFLLGWRTLVAFAVHGVLTGEERGLFPNDNDFKNRRAEVRKILRDFISITADPIRDFSKKDPAGETPLPKADRDHRRLRHGFTLLPKIEHITGVDKRLGQLADLTPVGPDNSNYPDNYPHRRRQNSDEF